MARFEPASGLASASLSSARRRRSPTARVALGVAIAVLWSHACTLSSDEFEPRSVVATPEGEAGATPSPPMPTPGCTGAGCSEDDEECPNGDCAEPPALARADAGPSCVGRPCEQSRDCASLVCRAGCCAEPSCSDGVANGDEADVDCAGRCAARCDVGQRCLRADDCDASVGCPASRGRCTPEACDNGILDGDEILVDCGGGECSGCAVGTACGSGADCASGSCGADARCRAPACDDGVRNQDELGVDCGGRCASPCPAGSACSADAECTSGVCGSVGCAPGSDAQCCQVASCSDGVLNGSEADLDCGSSDALCPRCEPGRECQQDVQCTSGVCEAGRCCGGTSGDCTRCAERLSATVDCATAPPGGSANCAGFLQCLANNASVCTTRFAAGCTNDPGGVCNHNTHGGNDGLGVQHATRVLAEAGCPP